MSRYRLDITVHVENNDGDIELPMHFAQGDGGFHLLELAVIFLPHADMLQLTLEDSVIDVRNAPALADIHDPVERGAIFSFWSQSPMTTVNALNNMQDLRLTKKGERKHEPHPHEGQTTSHCVHTVAEQYPALVHTRERKMSLLAYIGHHRRC